MMLERHWKRDGIQHASSCKSSFGINSHIYNLYCRTLNECKGLEFPDVGHTESEGYIFLTIFRSWYIIFLGIPLQMLASGNWWWGASQMECMVFLYQILMRPNMQASVLRYYFNLPNPQSLNYEIQLKFVPLCCYHTCPEKGLVFRWAWESWAHEGLILTIPSPKFLTTLFRHIGRAEA